MKTPKSLVLVIALIAMSFTNLDATLTEAERNYASKLLEETKDNVLKKVKGMSAAQLNFKASPESWSVAECVEHIAISENSLFGFCQMSLKQAADASKRSEVKMS